MLKAHNINGNWVWAKDFVRGQEYYCPECREPVFFVGGSDARLPHFSHYRESSCGWGSKESQAHEDKKNAIHDALASVLGPSNVYLESSLDDGQRPDVSFVHGDKIVAVEIQYSKISDADLAGRVLSYSDKGIPSLWLIGNLKSHINAIPADVFGGARDKFPAWVRRIARMYSDVGMDQASDSTDLIGVNLTPRIRPVKDIDGVWRNQISWDVTRSQLHQGKIVERQDIHGWRQLLWMPSVNAAGDVMRRGEKQKQTRRALPDNTPYYVDCDRQPVADQSIEAGSRPIEEIEREVDDGIAAHMGQVEARRAEVWGQMCRDRAQRERGCVPTAAQVAAVAEFRKQMQDYYRSVGARFRILDIEKDSTP